MLPSPTRPTPGRIPPTWFCGAILEKRRTESDTLHKALKYALSDGLIPKNAAAVKSPRPEKPEIHPLSPEQGTVITRSC
jgi:hypothetical protein